jgi:hypothetical protein
VASAARFAIMMSKRIMLSTLQIGTGQTVWTWQLMMIMNIYADVLPNMWLLF